jgi:hypothetical protein
LGSAARTEAASGVGASLPLAPLRGETGSFSFKALLLAVPGIPVRTDAAFAINGMLRLRLVLSIAVDRRLDLVFLAFLAMAFP